MSSLTFRRDARRKEERAFEQLANGGTVAQENPSTLAVTPNGAGDTTITLKPELRDGHELIVRTEGPLTAGNLIINAGAGQTVAGGASLTVVRPEGEDIDVELLLVFDRGTLDFVERDRDTSAASGAILGQIALDAAADTETLTASPTGRNPWFATITPNPAGDTNVDLLPILAAGEFIFIVVNGGGDVGGGGPGLVGGTFSLTPDAADQIDGAGVGVARLYSNPGESGILVLEATGANAWTTRGFVMGRNVDLQTVADGATPVDQNPVVLIVQPGAAPGPSDVTLLAETRIGHAMLVLVERQAAVDVTLTPEAAQQIDAGGAGVAAPLCFAGETGYALLRLTGANAWEIEASCFSHAQRTAELVADAGAPAGRNPTDLWVDNSGGATAHTLDPETRDGFILTIRGNGAAGGNTTINAGAGDTIETGANVIIAAVGENVVGQWRYDLGANDWVRVGLAAW